MAKFLDLTGMKFGRLKVIKLSKEVKSGKRFRKYWWCLCDCGNSHEVRTDGLTSGNVKSCGCMKKEQDKYNLTDKYQFKPKYEVQNRRLYQVWRGMNARCYNINDNRYDRYGKRGIIVCEEWKDFDTFAKWALKNNYSDNLTLDRIDNNGNYEPSNCKWSTVKEQCRNRSTNILVEYNDKLITLKELSEIIGISYSCINARYKRGKRGYDLIKPVTKPYKNSKKNI